VGHFSFPSSTTMLAFGLALPFFLEKSKFRYLFLILAILVGFSVIYTGFHFPRDVIFGIFFSILIVFSLNEIKKKWLEKLKI
jgi:undecaprenyl-diphosphatase